MSVTIRLGENTALAVSSASSAAADAATVAGSVAATTANAIATAADRVQTGLDRTATAASASSASTSATTATTQASAAQGYALTAQAIGLAAFIDAAANIVIGTGAAGSTGGTDGGLSIGTGAGVGILQTYSAKHIALGFKTGTAAGGASARGYVMTLLNAYAGTASVSNWACYIGAHAGQHANAIGVVSPGFGARATGTITFSTAAAGETITVNGVALVVGTDFTTGGTAAETARNLVRYLLASTNPLLTVGLYTRPNTTSAVVNVASLSRGTAGNAFTLAKTGANIAVSGAVLSGGTDISGAGLPANSAGDIAVGFGAMGYVQRSPTTRKAMIEATMGSNPADASYFKLGFNLTKTVTFLNAPVGALDVQRGASVEETLEALVATLNGSADTTIDDVTYWARNGRLFIEHDSALVNTFECRSYTSALVFPAYALGGGIYNIGSNIGIGYTALQGSFGSAMVAVGDSAGVLSSGANHITIGSNSGRHTNGRNRFTLGNATGNDIAGDGVGIVGNDVTGAAAEAWLPITSISTDGIVTFTSPHGMIEGTINLYSWRDRVSSGALIQSTPTGTGAWATFGTNLGFRLQIINATQARFIDSLPNPDTSARITDWRTSGTATNLDVSRHNKEVHNALVLGDAGTLVSGQVTIGSTRYVEGVKIDAQGLYVSAGQMRLPLIIPGTFAFGYINFGSDLANNDTISITDGTSTYTATAKTTISTTVTSGQDREFLIGGSRLISIQNFLASLALNDDQSAARKVANRVKMYALPISGVGVRLHYVLLDTNNPAVTLSTTASGATVTVSSSGTYGNLPRATSTIPPKDNGMVMATTSPFGSGGPRMMRYTSSTDNWAFI